MYHPHPSAFRRFSSGQRFVLSPRGQELVKAYRSHMAAAVRPAVRASFETARTAWAREFDLEPDDGLYLSEVAEAPMTLRELGEALAVCGQSAQDVARFIRKLAEAGLVTKYPVP